MSKTPPFQPLTDREARQLTYSDLIDRLTIDSEHWTARRPRTEAQHAAYREFTHILHYIDPLDPLKATSDLIAGRPNDYFKRTPAGDGLPAYQGGRDAQA